MEKCKNGTAAQELARSRQIVQSYGKYFGTQLYTVQSYNPDLGWKEDVANDKNTLRKPVNVFVIKAIDIKSIAFIERDLDDMPKIVINKEDNDPSLVFPLVPPAFKEATRANIQECIDQYVKNGTPIFFPVSEREALNQHLKVINTTALRFFEELSRKYMALSQTVRDVMDQADAAQIEYMRQCGIPNDEIEKIEMSVTVKEE